MRFQARHAYERFPTPAHPLARLRPDVIAVALVWLYQGLWCKLLQPSRHFDVIASVPGLSNSAARWALSLLGLLETGVAVWVLAGCCPRRAALFQTVLLVAMNASGLLWAGHRIAEPGGMLVNNFVFLVLVWSVALRRQPTGVLD